MLATLIKIEVSKFLPLHLFYRFSIKNRKKHFFNIADEPEQATQLVYPNQYPTNLVDAAPMIARGRPVRFISPKDEIPEIKMMSNDDAIIREVYGDEWKSPQNAYKLNVGLIGPVNSGKSELMARLSHKVSAVSPKKNTTDEILHAYKSLEIQNEQGIRNVQLKYFDTPGLSYHKTGFLSRGWSVLGELDFTLLVIDSSKKFDQLLEESINRLEKHRQYQSFMKALVLNKIDLVENKRKFHGLIAQIERYGKFDKIFYTSALTGYGVTQIEKYLVGMAKKGEWQCPKEAKTDSSEIEIAEEMLKEAIFHRLYNQVPYETLIECDSFAVKSNGVHFIQFRVIAADQYVQRMIIGKKGRNVNWMRDHFKTNYAKAFGKQVQVHVRVVMRKKRLMRQSQQLQSSYFKQQRQQVLGELKKKLTAQGKMLK